MLKPGDPIRFKHLCPEDKSKLAKLISKVATLHDRDRTDRTDRTPLSSLPLQPQPPPQPQSPNNKSSNNNISSAELLKELSAYKIKFTKSLTIVKEYQSKLISLAQENERMKKETADNEDVERLKVEFIRRVNIVKQEGESHDVVLVRTLSFSLLSVSHRPHFRFLSFPPIINSGRHGKQGLTTRETIRV